MTESNQHPDRPCRSAAIIQQMKVANERRGKFSLRTLFVMVTIAAALLALLKATIGFDVILPFAYPLLGVLYGFAPLCCWAVGIVGMGFRRPKIRVCFTYGSVVLIAITFWMVSLVKLGPSSVTLIDFILGAACTAVFWTYQMACIAVVRRLLFRGVLGDPSIRTE